MPIIYFGWYTNQINALRWRLFSIDDDINVSHTLHIKDYKHTYDKTFAYCHILFHQSLIKKINNYVYMCLEVQSAYVNVKALLEAKIKINWNVVINTVIINMYDYHKFRLGRYETPKFRTRHVVYWKQRSRGHGWYRLSIFLCFSTIYSIYF